MRLKTNERNTSEPLRLHARASGSGKRPEADTVDYSCVSISPPPAKKWHFKPKLFPPGERGWAIRSQAAWHPRHNPTHTWIRAKTCAHTLSCSLSLCLPLKLCQCNSVPERSTRVILKDLQQLVCASQMQSTPIICWNPFYSPSLSEDRFRTAPLGPDDWTCLTE